MESNQRKILIDNLDKLSVDQVEEFLVVNGYLDPVDFPHNLAKVLLKYAAYLIITDALYDLYMSSVLPSLVSVTNIQYTTQQIKNMSDDNLATFANILHLTHVKNKSTLKSRILRILSFAGIINTASEELPMDVIKIIGLNTPYYKLTDFCISTQACDVYFWMFKLTYDLNITNQELEVMRLTQPDITTNVDTIRHQYFTIKTGCNNLALSEESVIGIPFFLDSYLNIIDEIKAGNYSKAVNIIKIRDGQLKKFMLYHGDAALQPIKGVDYINTILYYTILFLRHQHTINSYNVGPIYPINIKYSKIVTSIKDIAPILQHELEDYNSTVAPEVTYSQYQYDKGDIPTLAVSGNKPSDINDGLFIGAYVIENKKLQDYLIRILDYSDIVLHRLKFIAESIRGDEKSYQELLEIYTNDASTHRYFEEFGILRISLILILLFGNMHLVGLYFEYVGWSRENLSYLVRFTLPGREDDMISIVNNLTDEGLLVCLDLCVELRCYDKIPYLVNKILEVYEKEDLESIGDINDLRYRLLDLFTTKAYLLANSDGTVNIHVYRTFRAVVNLLEKIHIEGIHIPLYEEIKLKISPGFEAINPHASIILESLGIYQ